MIEVDGIKYLEKQNIDEELPPCSFCHIPITKCKQQCKQYGNNYFFVLDSSNKNDAKGCIWPAFCIGAIFVGIIICLILMK